MEDPVGSRVEIESAAVKVGGRFEVLHLRMGGNVNLDPILPSESVYPVPTAQREQRPGVSQRRSPCDY